MRIPGFDPMFVDFKDVGRMVKLGKAEAGLVIHEGQLTAREDGLPRGRGPGGELEGAHRRCRCRWA